MITKQHVLMSTLALTNLSNNSYALRENLNKNLPFILLPDAIRFYVGERQAGHFESFNSSVSWMQYPTNLKALKKEDAREKIQFYVVPDIPKCVIGEDTNLQTFDMHNWTHPHYFAIRAHLQQDIALDNCLRNDLIDASLKYNDVFVLKHNNHIIDGMELRKQVAMFEELGFLKLVEIFYNRTGILANRAWFDDIVKTSLYNAYTEELAANTYKYMVISDEQDARINNHQFSFTDEDLSKPALAAPEKLEDILNKLYSTAFISTCSELRHC